ncbi:MAG: phosphatase PAP2 family protein [Acidimicrobiales bacterium]
MSPVNSLATALPPGPVVADVRVLPPRGLNTSWYLDVNRFARHTSWAHGFVHAYALWLGPVLLAAAFLALYVVAWWRRAPRVAALLVLGGMGTLVALGLNQLVGHAAGELRPYATYPRALVLVGKTSDYSFPSDHSIVAGGLTMSLLLVAGEAVWRWGGRRGGGDGRSGGGRGPERSGVVTVLVAANVVLGLFLCFARVYVGAHYPGDVVAGYLLSSLVVVVASLLRPLAYRAVDVLEPTVLGAVLQRPHRVAAR